MKNNSKIITSIEEFKENLNISDVSDNHYSLNEGIFGKKNETPNPVNNTPFGFNKFIQDFIENVNNPIMMSMFYRMLDTNKFIKFGKEVYSFTDEEKEKLEKIKPLFDNLVETISKIKNIEKGG